MRNTRSRGISTIEILMVIAIIGVLGGLAAMGWRGLAQREQARSTLVSLQQAMWQGATAASARGESLRLDWVGDELRVVGSGGNVVRSWSFPASTETTLDRGEIVAFSPPGRIADLAALPDPLTIVVNGRTATLEVSLIGEAEVTW